MNSLISLVEQMPAELDYCPNVSIQTAIGESYVEKIEPTTVLTYGKPISFILASSVDYTNLSGMQLEVTCKVTRQGGSACNHGAAASGNPTDKVCVANNLLHSMFKEVSFIVNGVEVEKVDQYPYRAYIADLTSVNHEARDRHWRLTGWKKDTVAKLDKNEKGEGNTAMDARTAPFESSSPVKFLGKLHSSLVEQGLCILPNHQMRIELHPSPSGFALIAGSTTATYELQILDIALWVERKAVSPALQEAHALIFSRLPENKWMVPIVEKDVKRFTITKDVTKATLEIFSNEVLPDRVLIGFLSNDSAGERFTANPFYFQHFNVKHLQATVNGVQTPRKAFTPTWTNLNGYLREYTALLDEFGGREANNLDITHQEFANGYTLFPFHTAARADGVLGPQRRGSVKLELGFAEQLTNVINVYVFYDRRSTLTLPVTAPNQ